MDLLDGKPIVVLIDDELIANRKTNRPYIHVVTLTKKHQADVAVSIAVLGDKNLVTHPQGEIAKVLQNFISSNKNNN